MGTSICSVYAADTTAYLGTATEPAAVGYMERISAPANFDFEIISTGRDSVVAEFTAAGRITNPPYVGEKGTKNTAEKVTNLQYVLEYDKEYSFVYTVIEDDIETVYNSFLTVERGSSVEVIFNDIIKNVIIEDEQRSSGVALEIEPNNSLYSANQTYDDYDNRGSITSTSDVDWWKVSFTQAGRANFWLGNIPAGCDFDISVFNAAGVEIGYSGNNAQEQELVQLDVTPDTYYIKIETYSGVSSSQYLFRTKWYPYFDSEVYTIRNVGNSMYLTVGQACNASSLSYAYIYTALASEADGQNNGQRMRINYDTTGFYTIAPLCSFNGQYRVLDVYGGLSSAAKQLWLYPDNGASEEHFVFELQSDNTYIISFKDNPSYVLDVNSSNNNKVFANTRTGANSQKWTVTADTTYNAKEALYNTYGWQWPLASNYYLTSSYGRRTLDNGVSYEFHSAVDISANNGTAVLCPTTATYMDSGYYSVCGYYLIIETNNTVYNSNQKIKLLFQHLKEEATVTNTSMENAASITKGTTIAKTGDTGSPGSYHLHFGVISDGSNVFVDTGDGYDDRTFANTEQPLMFFPNSNFTYY